MRRRLPPLNPLRAFEVAARVLSFARAAEELCVTPSAVSHQIRTLEDNLGVTLFVRDARSLSLTPAGKAYLPSVQEAFRHLAHATQRLGHLVEQPVLKINVPPTFATKWLLPRVHRFYLAYPGIPLRVATEKQIVDFEREDHDLAIRYGTGTYPELYSEKCLDVELFPVCAPELLKGPMPLATPGDLRHHVMLHDDSAYADVSNPTWTTWLEYAGASDVPMTPGPSFSPSHLVVDAAMRGHGVALAKGCWVLDDLAAGRLVKPFGPVLKGEFGYFLTFPVQNAREAKTKAFVSWIRSELARDGLAHGTTDLHSLN